MLQQQGHDVGDRLMTIARAMAMIGVLLAAACTPMSEQGWIRIKGAAVESDGRELKECRLDVWDAATDKRKVGQELVHEGRSEATEETAQSMTAEGALRRYKARA